MKWDPDHNYTGARGKEQVVGEIRQPGSSLLRAAAASDVYISEATPFLASEWPARRQKKREEEKTQYSSYSFSFFSHLARVC